MEEIVDGEDRISELPIQIIHDILRRIRRQYGLKEEARTCVLSATWNSIWKSRPEVIINQSIHKRFMNSTEKFVKFVDDSLRSHVEQNLRIEILRLMNLRLPELASHIDRWLNLAIKHNVRSLYISLACNMNYSIPDAIYGAKTLTELSLNKCNFEIDNSNSTTNKLQRIFSTCPFIRDLKIGHCTGIQNLHVFGLVNLEKLELRMCKKLEKVEIWAPNLRQFVYVGAPLDEHSGTFEPEPLPCKIDILDGYNTLKCLQLEATTLSEQQFEYQLSKFPALEVLKLKRCNVMKNIKVVSEKLKSFTLSQWDNLEQVNMQAPNLMEFNFQGYRMPFSISTMDPSNLEQANLDFYLQQSDDSYNFGDVDTSWYNNLLDFVQKFNYSNGLILIICCKEGILIYEDPSEILVPPTRKLELCIENSSMHLESFVYEMMFSQPMTVSIVHGMDSKILQAFSETTKECRMKQYRRLNEVTIHKGTAEDGGTSCLNSWLKSTSLIERITTFMFKWEEPPN